MKRTVQIFLAVLLGASLLLVPAPAGAQEAQPGEGSEAGWTALAQASAGVRDSVVRVYLATFDREPDTDGLDYWVGRYLDGFPLESVAQAFMDSEEWRSTYGHVDDTRFVELLYANVLGRAPDDAGRRYWLDELARGRTRRSVLLGFSESPEFVSDTRTAPPEPPPPSPFPAVPDNSGNGRRIIYGNSAQRLWLIDARDRIVDSYLVSGRRGVPAPGQHYQVFSKSELAWAGHDGITMRWMVRFAHGSELAIGFHAIPRDRYGRPIQSESELGSYRSAGCVRQADHKAEALYAWAPIGTPVVVLR